MIIRHSLSEFMQNSSQDKNMSISLTDTAISQIASEGFDPTYGARPLKRYIQSHIETLIAMYIIKGLVTKGQNMIIDFINGEFVINA